MLKYTKIPLACFTNILLFDERRLLEKTYAQAFT